MSDARMRNLSDAKSAGPVGSWRVVEREEVSHVGRGWRESVVVKWVRRASIEGGGGGIGGIGCHSVGGWVAVGWVGLVSCVRVKGGL